MANMLEALWSVEFLSSWGAGGSGILVLDGGRIFGGNDSLLYTGRYEVVGNRIAADVRVETYAIVPGANAAAGFQRFSVKVVGPQARDNLFLTGHVVEDPSRTMTIRAVRRAELP